MSAFCFGVKYNQLIKNQMSKRIFTREQIEDLLKNKNIASCSNKSITFSKEFKISAVRQYNELGLSPREIFRQANLEIELIGKEVPDDCLLRWKRIFKKKGIEGLSEVRGKNGRGGKKKKMADLSDKDKIKRLEAEVAYLKAENDFLAKLRNRRAE